MRTVARTSTTAAAVCAGLALALAPAASAQVPVQASPGVVAAAMAAPTAGLLHVGSSGAQVQEWQALLNRIFREAAVAGTTLVEDGVFGPATKQATVTVQAHLRLAQDGVVGPRTRSAVSGLGFATGVGGTTPSTNAHADERRLHTGLRGADVREWQRMINIAVDLGRLDHPRLSQDGAFGPQTRSATLALQNAVEVTADGVVGPVTREATGWLLEG